MGADGLTRKEILSMKAGSELEILVAEKVMGWRRWTCSDYDFKIADLFPPDTTIGQHGTWTMQNLPFAEYAGVLVPQYSRSIDVAFAVENEIAKRFLMIDYIRELRNLVMTPGQIDAKFHWDIDEDTTNLLHIWRFTHATPEQRCKAALLAIMEESQ